MSIERVRDFFRSLHMEDQIMEFDVSSATVELAAQAIHCEPARIAKSISFSLNGKSILIVTSGDAKIDNRKYKERFGIKPKMLSPEETLEQIGHSVGGICPFGINEGVSVCLDISLKRFTSVFPACGSSNSAIELTLPQLEKYIDHSGWVDVCKNWTAEEEAGRVQP